METLEIQKENNFIFKIRSQAYFIGDVVLEIKHNPVVGKKIAANYSFNTAFFSSGLKNVEVKLNELSPLSSVKSGLFEKDFKLILTFKKICVCPETTPYDKRCSKCQPYLLTEEKKWETIYEILDKKPKVPGEWLLFGDPLKPEKLKQSQSQPKSI